MWGRLARPGTGICPRPAWGALRVRGAAGASRGAQADKVALVTASTEGIGLAVARRLAQDGAHVVLSSRKQSNVDRAVAQLRAENLSVSGTVCHVGRAEDRERLVATALERHGAIDILVSNAAVNPFFGNTLDASEDVWNKILQINVTATAMLVGLVVPHMEKRGGGSIVIVSSIAGFTPFPALGPYSVSKTALLGLIKALAPELGPRKIRINGLAPGVVQTQFSAALWKDEAMKEKMMENLRVQRLGVPSDCAGIVAFLCSPDASYITGETVVVAGGAPSRL
ncbi:dehydrogenase/reductase SDR family member 4-like isoform X1 [Emydura macquarii macquarii]|uniref:dehydrogenase/reductase SDR family member 4-like isoform X1 n=1 Tax=Emydura macquarii macquarii TaxID=1129001 RepID=UPI00352A621C